MDGKEIRLEKLIAYGSRKAVIQNLEDAGCDPGSIKCCMAYMKQGKKKELLKQLDEHRAGLLNRGHKARLLSEDVFCLEQKQIDCLDYLVYQISLC